MDEVGDVARLAVAVVALEATAPVVFFTRREIDGAGRIFIGVLIHPGTDDAVGPSGPTDRFKVEIGLGKPFKATFRVVCLTPGNGLSAPSRCMITAPCIQLDAVSGGNLADAVAS